MQAHVHLIRKYCLKVVKFGSFVDPRCLDRRMGRRNTQRIWITAESRRGLSENTNDVAMLYLGDF